MTKESIGITPAFPVPEASAFCAGMTYRQWLIGIIAAGMSDMTHEQAKQQAIIRADLIIAQLDKEANFPH
jgi:hypothetical protein